MQFVSFMMCTFNLEVPFQDSLELVITSILKCPVPPLHRDMYTKDYKILSLHFVIRRSCTKSNLVQICISNMQRSHFFHLVLVHVAFYFRDSHQIVLSLPLFSSTRRFFFIFRKLLSKLLLFYAALSCLFSLVLFYFSKFQTFSSWKNVKNVFLCF